MCWTRIITPLAKTAPVDQIKRLLVEAQCNTHRHRFWETTKQKPGWWLGTCFIFHYFSIYWFGTCFIFHYFSIYFWKMMCWLVVWNIFFHRLGMSSSQMTNSHFSGWVNHQKPSIFGPRISWTNSSSAVYQRGGVRFFNGRPGDPVISGDFSMKSRKKCHMNLHC